MPTLEWIGKEKVVNHHQEVSYRVLERRYSYGDAGSDYSGRQSGSPESVTAALQGTGEVRLYQCQRIPRSALMALLDSTVPDISSLYQYISMQQKKSSVNMLNFNYIIFTII